MKLNSGLNLTTMRNNNLLSLEIAAAGLQPHCLNSATCSKEFGGCGNCRRFDGVAIEAYDHDGIIDNVGFYRPAHASIADALTISIETATNDYFIILKQ